MLKEGWWRHPVVVGKSCAVWIQILPCCAFWPQDEEPKAALAGFYLLITDRGYDTQREYTLSDPARLWEMQRQGSNLFFSLLLLLFFLFLLLQAVFAFWLQLNLFLTTEAKKGIECLVLLGLVFCYHRLFMGNISSLICEHTRPHGKWTKTLPKSFDCVLSCILRKKIIRRHS